MKKATIKDIANHAGVSVMTISRFFNSPDRVSHKTKDRIKKAIQDIDYHPNEIARSLVTKRTSTIGVILPDIRNPFFGSIFHAIELVVREYNFNLLLCNTQESEEEERRYVNLLVGRNVDGIIIAPVSRNSIDALKRKNQKTVLVDRIFKDVDADSITSDHYNSMWKAIEYLINLGHQKIGLIKGPAHLYPYAERLRAYQNVLNKYDIPLNSNYIRSAEIQDADISYSAALDLLSQSEKPTAMVACNNILGMGALRAVFKSQLNIPRDISFIVFDRLASLDLITPMITHVAQEPEFIGSNAARMLMDRILDKGSKTYQKIVINPEFVVGESCKDLRDENF